MQTLTVTKIIPAPPGDVFEAYIDHEKLANVPGVRSCALAREGDTEKNGTGAIRELDCGALWLREEITGLDRPHRVEYRIRKSKPASRHEYGQVDFIEVPGGTKVTWTTKFGALSAAGPVMDPLFAVLFGVAFRLVLRDVGRRAVAAGRTR
ncbi:MAG: SRPBCC family protein [Streptosporangiales bacterium]|jgi:uncharacterized protein YndB with AHSA1/START domain|nr:SRPBCC family protein [Streptosporangiales bacterium]